LIKKIAVSDLREGMYIHDLNCDWMNHPFVQGRFLLKSPKQLHTILDLGVPEIYIDTKRGLDAMDAPTQQEVAQKLDQELIQIASTPVPKGRPRTLDEELPRARKLHAEAHDIVRCLLISARSGHAVELERVEDLADKLGESLVANPGALMSICRMRTVDEYTFLHSVSVGTLMIAFTSFMGLDPATVREAGIGGLVHDLGKMKTPSEILNKPDRLTPEEFEIMKAHPGDGHRILQDAKGVREEQLLITIQHHERLDGSGYPYKLTAANINPLAQMAAIVDVYDALTADRCYHKAMPPTDALRKLIEWSKHAFNSELVHKFIRCVGIYPVGSAVVLESGRIAIVTQQNESDMLSPSVIAVYDSRRRRFISPQAVDLAGPAGHGGADRIVTSTDPEKWGINPRDFLI
jgi:HD-GYP domain-containing protein (c-di-GMP phosphodiesterase class II)